MNLITFSPLLLFFHLLLILKHPSMYERALINPRMKAAFKDKVDLWSVGATFFHVATGRLPYSPYAKRNDRTKMLGTH